jgi:hypothetical protein
VGRTRAPHVHLKEGPSHYKQGALRLVEMKKKKKKKKKKKRAIRPYYPFFLQIGYCLFFSFCFSFGFL